MVPQDSHLTHRPSVRTRRSSGGVVCSIDFLSRLNQAIVSVSATIAEESAGRRVSLHLNLDAVEARSPLVVDASLGQNALCVGVFDLAHLGDQVGEFDERGMSVAAGADHVDALRAAF